MSTDERPRPENEVDVAALQFALWCVSRCTVASGSSVIDPLAARAIAEIERLTKKASER